MIRYVFASFVLLIKSPFFKIKPSGAYSSLKNKTMFMEEHFFQKYVAENYKTRKYYALK